jgi:hypothetical protein
VLGQTTHHAQNETRIEKEEDKSKADISGSMKTKMTLNHCLHSEDLHHAPSTLKRVPSGTSNN